MLHRPTLWRSSMRLVALALSRRLRASLASRGPNSDDRRGVRSAYHRRFQNMNKLVPALLLLMFTTGLHCSRRCPDGSSGRGVHGQECESYAPRGSEDAVRPSSTGSSDVEHSPRDSESDE